MRKQNDDKVILIMATFIIKFHSPVVNLCIYAIGLVVLKTKEVQVQHRWK